MKRLTLIIFLLLGLFFIGFSDTLLGLRTVEATSTEVASATVTAKPLLKTIDPLLASFREGWAVPTIPGWTDVVLGNVTFKVPKGFSVPFTKSGANYDATLNDISGKQFAQLYVYQLDAYQLEELFGDLIGSLYAGKATNDKLFEEYKELTNGKVAYFTKLVMKDEKSPFPILFLYEKGTEVTRVKSGTVLMLLFEPTEYLGEDQQEQLTKWIEGIAGSLISSYAPVVQKQVTEPIDSPAKVVTPSQKVSKAEDFGSKLADRIADRDWISDMPQGWKEASGDSFSLFYPGNYTTEYFSTDNIEGYDFGYSGTTIAKFFVGYTEEEFSADSIFEEVTDSYLSGLGEYEFSKETPYLDYEMGFLKIYELDFENYRAWVVLFSEALIEETFEGEYLIFVGIAPVRDSKVWEDIYLDMLMSLEF
jgi:hypothetical protein